MKSFSSKFSRFTAQNSICENHGQEHYFFSCTPEKLADEFELQACCDQGEHIPSPPPPLIGG